VRVRVCVRVCVYTYVYEYACTPTPNQTHTHSEYSLSSSIDIFWLDSAGATSATSATSVISHIYTFEMSRSHLIIAIFGRGEATEISPKYFFPKKNPATEEPFHDRAL